MKRKIIPGVLFLLFLLPVNGETLDLSQLIDQSVKNSEKVKIQNARVEKSVNDRKSIAMNFLPKTKIDIKMLELKYAPEPEPLTLDITPLMGLMEQSINESSPIPIDLPDEVPPMEVPIEIPQHQRKLDVTLVQPVTQLWEIYHGYKARKINSDIQKLKTELTKDQIEIQVTEYFLTYNMINEVLTLLEETDKQLDRYLYTTEKYIENGLADKRALLKIDIEKAKVAKEKAKYEGVQEVIKTALAYLIEKDEKDFEIESYSAGFQQVKIDTVSIIENQKKSRIEFRLLKKGDEIRGHLNKKSFQQFVPQIAFTMGFKKDWDYTVINPEGVFFVGGVLSWDLGVGTAKAVFEHKSVKAESTIRILENIKLRKDMALQIKKMLVDVKVLEKTMLIDGTQIESAKESLRIEEEKYKQNMTSETDLLSAVLKLKKAETSKITNRYRHELALRKISLTSGLSVAEIAEN